jgi:hypothetical protein
MTSDHLSSGTNVSRARFVFPRNSLRLAESFAYRIPYRSTTFACDPFGLHGDVAIVINHERNYFHRTPASRILQPSRLRHPFYTHFDQPFADVCGVESDARADTE